jgi:hypothetical protein
MIEFFYKLRRAISWGVFMFNNSWWDYGYTKTFMDKKLKEMENGFRTKAQYYGALSHARIIQIARKYLEMSTDEYWSGVENQFNKKIEERYGKHKFKFEPFEGNKDLIQLKITYGGKENEHAGAVSCRYHKYMDYVRDRYYQKFWDVMKKHIGYFWN